MNKSQILHAGLFLELFTIGLVVRAESIDQKQQPDIPRIEVPEGSALQLSTTSCASSAVVFQGHIELEGRLDVYWYEHVIDAESPTDLLTETRLVLDFYPTPDSRRKLPLVSIADEVVKQDMKIRLNELSQRQAEALLTLFGFQTTKKMLAQKKSRSFFGRLSLGVFSTYIECNARHFDGEPLSFKATSSPVEMQDPPSPQGCS